VQIIETETGPQPETEHHKYELCCREWRSCMARFI